MHHRRDHRREGTSGRHHRGQSCPKATGAAASGGKLGQGQLPGGGGGAGGPPQARPRSDTGRRCDGAASGAEVKPGTRDLLPRLRPSWHRGRSCCRGQRKQRERGAKAPDRTRERERKQETAQAPPRDPPTCCPCTAMAAVRALLAPRLAASALAPRATLHGSAPRPGTRVALVSGQGQTRGRAAARGRALAAGVRDRAPPAGAVWVRRLRRHGAARGLRVSPCGPGTAPRKGGASP